MNIIKINEKSKMKDLYNKSSGVDTDYFLHRMDKNLPPHSFKRFDMKPDLIKTLYQNSKTEFTIPKKGFLAKMFIKHQITYETEDEAKTVEAQISDRLGAFIFNKMELQQYGNTVESLNETGILERMNTSLTNNIVNLKEAIDPERNVRTLTFYTPLLFSLNSDINHFLDMKHVQELKLVVDMESYGNLGLSIISIDDDPDTIPESHNMILMIDFMSIENYEEYSKRVFSKPQMIAIENNILENGTFFQAVGGINNFRLRTRELVKKIIVRAVSTLPDRQSIGIYDIKLTANNETIYEAYNLLESLLFSKNYQGLASHKVPDATDDGILEIQFEIPNFRNSNSGCLNMDEIYKDCNLQLYCENDCFLYVSYLTYDGIVVYPDGIILKADPNNTPYLDDYRQEEEPKESKPDMKDVKDGKNIDK